MVTGSIRGVLNAEDLIAEMDAARPASSVAPSGFAELDSLTGGMLPGRVWIVLGVPGQGRTTLLIQWAAAIAGQTGQTVHLVTPRESAPVVAARLLSLTGRLPLHRLTNRHLDETHQVGFTEARERVQALSLCLYAKGEDIYVPEVHPMRAAMKPSAVLIDDADLVSGLTPSALALLAAAGLFVVISLPRHHVALGPGDEADLDPAWARAADVILEVRHTGLAAGAERPGEADLHIRKNRWGYVRTLPVLHQAHFSRFVTAAT